MKSDCFLNEEANFMVNYVGERPWRLMKSPNKGRMGKATMRGDQIKFIDLRFERWQVVRSRKARRRQDVP